MSKIVIIFALVALQLRTTIGLVSDYALNEELESSPVSQHQHRGYEFEMTDILGLEELDMQRTKRSSKALPSLRNSASRFLLEIYDELSDDKNDVDVMKRRRKRATVENNDVNFITPLDRIEIDRCNNIVTFASKSTIASKNQVAAAIGDDEDTLMRFNTKAVPAELRLVHAALRAYQNASMFASSQHSQPQNITITVYQRIGQQHAAAAAEYRIITSLNSSTTYTGWLEFNVTRLLNRWLMRRQARHELKILVHLPPATRHTVTNVERPLSSQGNAPTPIELRPFIVGYFNGPDLMEKVQRLRFKRDVQRRIQRRAAAKYQPQPQHQRSRPAPPPPPPVVYHAPKTCERLNFTLDFKDLQMHNWVIAPKKFEAYFCGGECNFPLNAHMNATGHAIVQTLIRLKQPHLPKPCCVPTVLGDISILHYLSDDSVNLSKYPQSVAKQCGCH